MSIVNVHEAKTNLSKLIDSVESGVEAEIILARNGRPAARIVPLADKALTPKRDVSLRIGLAKGKYILPDDFDADNDLIQALFEGRIIE